MQGVHQEGGNHVKNVSCHIYYQTVTSMQQIMNTDESLINFLRKHVMQSLISFSQQIQQQHGDPLYNKSTAAQMSCTIIPTCVPVYLLGILLPVFNGCRLIDVSQRTPAGVCKHVDSEADKLL